MQCFQVVYIDFSQFLYARAFGRLCMQRKSKSGVEYLRYATSIHCITILSYAILATPTPHPPHPPHPSPPPNLGIPYLYMVKLIGLLIHLLFD